MKEITKQEFKAIIESRCKNQDLLDFLIDKEIIPQKNVESIVLRDKFPSLLAKFGRIEAIKILRQYVNVCDKAIHYKIYNLKCRF